MLLQFQKCTSSDLDLLVEIARKTFIAAFEKDNDPDDFKNYIDNAFDTKQIKKQLVNSDSSFYFTFWEEELVGYFKLNQNESQTDDKSPNSVELERIYVLQRFQGKQIGKHMLNKAIQLASQSNKKYLWLGVWQKNTNAIRFYEKNGFLKFSTHPYYIGKDRQTDWLMRYKLKKPQLDNNRGFKHG